MKQVVCSTGGSARGRDFTSLVSSKKNDFTCSVCVWTLQPPTDHRPGSHTICSISRGQAAALAAALTLQLRRPDTLSLHQV